MPLLDVFSMRLLSFISSRGNYIYNIKFIYIFIYIDIYIIYIDTYTHTHTYTHINKFQKHKSLGKNLEN